LWIIEPKVFSDARGYFMETWKQDVFEQHIGKITFIQENESKSSFGVFRGFHYQEGETAQAKLVRVVSGKVWDIAVDIRKDSPTFGQWEAVELSAENHRQFFIPRGFGHAFLTLTDDVEFCYKADNFYNYEADRSIRFSDPDIAVDWGTDQLILSEKDLSAPLLRDSDCSFIYGA